MKLSLKPIHIEKKLEVLLKAIDQTGKETQANKTRLHAKIDRWREQLKEVQIRLEYIRRQLIPKLEKILGIRIKNIEIVQIAMFQPSTKNLFLELDTHYKNERNNPLEDHEFADLIALSEIAQVIALLGDSVIDMGVLYQLWQPDPSDVGHITQEKSEIVSNVHMANLCDRWGLYEHRIHFDPDVPGKAEIEHDKGTLVEAIFGIIQMEHGFRKVMENIKHLL
ncbi:MAG: ribonuclease III domain-containing protein [Candidatus Odinarchaeota archaeon]